MCSNSTSHMTPVYLSSTHTQASNKLHVKLHTGPRTTVILLATKKPHYHTFFDWQGHGAYFEPTTSLSTRTPSSTTSPALSQRTTDDLTSQCTFTACEQDTSPNFRLQERPKPFKLCIKKQTQATIKVNAYYDKQALSLNVRWNLYTGFHFLPPRACLPGDFPRHFKVDLFV